jgi:hypothetical protein
MQNLIVAASNLYAIRAVSAWPEASLGRALTVGAALSSISYHLLERQRHSMPGVSCDFNGSALSYLKRALGLALGFEMSWRCYLAGRFDLLRSGCGALLINGISEMFYYAPQTASLFPIYMNWQRRRAFYVFWKCIWHILAFHLCARVAAL